MLPSDPDPGDAPLVEEGLLAAIAAEPEAVGPRLVYADWLQSRGDPRGELIIVQHELRARPADEELRERERELVERAAAELAVPGLRRGAIGRWELGFVDELALGGSDLAALRRTAPDWLDRPALRMVRGLDVMLRKPGAFRAIAKRPLARSIRRLRMGTASLLLEPAAAAAIARMLPALEDLELRALRLPPLDALGALPLAGFAYHGPRLDDPALEQLARLPPGLLRLELRVPVTGPGALAALRPICTGEVLPDLRRLALIGPFPMGELLEALAASGRARTLDALTLDMNRIADDQQRRLEAHRDALAKLQLLPHLGGHGPTDSTACQQLGAFLQYRLGRPASAVPLYEQAVRLNPQNTVARHGLGIALRNAKRPEESLGAFDALLRDTAPTAGIFYSRHFANCDLRRHAEAAADLEQVVALDPRHADAWNALGIERQRTGDLEGALAAFDRVIEVQPTHDYAPRNRAELLLEHERPAEALAIVEGLLGAKPGNAWLVYLRGAASLALDRGEDAIAAAAEVLAAPGDRYHEAALVLRALARLGGGEQAARADLAAALRHTDCPGWVSLCWLVEGLLGPGPWAIAAPPAILAPPAISAALADHARAVRPAGAAPLHAAEPWDHAEAAERAIAAALQAGDRPLAVARIRALHEFLAAEPKPVVLGWSHGVAMVFRAVGAALDDDGRTLLSTVMRATRGRLPREALLATAE